MSDLYNLTPSKIVAYTTPFCPDCCRAKDFFKKHNIPIIEININKDSRASDFVRQVNNGNRSVPTIIFPGGDILVEPSKDELRLKLDAM